MFDTKKIYCKYVINTLLDRAIFFRRKNINNIMIEDELYNSYIKLEEIIKQEHY